MSTLERRVGAAGARRWSASSAQSTSELVFEAQQLLDTALAQAGVLRRSGSAEDAGPLLRTVHSYKSLTAFAGADERAALAGKMEDYLQAIWRGVIDCGAADHDLVHRVLLTLGSDRASHDHGATITGLVAELEGAYTARTDPRTEEAVPPSRPRGHEGGNPSYAAVRLSLSEVTDLHSASYGLVRMARLLEGNTHLSEAERAELARTLLHSANRLEEALRRHVRVTLRAFLLPMVGATQTMAAGHGKSVLVRLEIPDLDMERAFLQSLRPSLLHLLRNAVAHGIEPPEQRLSVGKSGQGRITLSVAVADGRLHLRVQDDGRGFDRCALRRAAAAAGALPPSSIVDEAADLRLALLPGLSTTPMVDDLSGRGLGLPVVAEDVAALGGAIALASQPGEGSQVTLVVPIPARPGGQPLS